MNIKQIIDREMRVVLIFLVCGLAIFFTWDIWTPLFEPKFPFTYRQVQNGPYKYQVTFAGRTFQIVTEKKATEKDLYETALALAQQIKVIKPAPFYDFLCTSKNAGLFIAFGGGYLFYLVLRLIILALRTLKEK